VFDYPEKVNKNMGYPQKTSKAQAKIPPTVPLTIAVFTEEGQDAG
jgi:hypothetical protein